LFVEILPALTNAIVDNINKTNARIFFILIISYFLKYFNYTHSFPPNSPPSPFSPPTELLLSPGFTSELEPSPEFTSELELSPEFGLDQGLSSCSGIGFGPTV